MINSVTLVLVASLFLSLLINALGIWYSVRLTRTLMYFSENMNDLLDSLIDYSNHVKSVYGLESYYGDQVLHNLLKHSRDIVEQVESFDDILYLSEEEGEEVDEQEGQEIDEEDPFSEREAKEASNPTRIWSSF